MVRALTDDLIFEARSIALQLDNAGMKIESAFWYREDDGDSFEPKWMLYFGCANFYKKGPLALYRELHQILGDSSAEGSSISRNVILSSNIRVKPINSPEVIAAKNTRFMVKEMPGWKPYVSSDFALIWTKRYAVAPSA